MSSLNMQSHGRGMDIIRRDLGWKVARVHLWCGSTEEVVVESVAWAADQVDRIKPYLSDDDPEVRKAALFALKHMFWVTDGAEEVPVIDVYGTDRAA